MPRVEALKCRQTGTLFLAEDKPVKAWQCPSTGKLFARKDRYKEHLRTLAKTRHTERKRKKHLAVTQAKIDELHRCSSIAEIERWLEENAQVLADRKTPHDKTPPKVEFRNVKLRVVWSENLSNTHSAPPIGKKSNWGSRDKDTPTGYPGFSGHIVLEDVHTVWDYGFFELLRLTRIHTGTGNGGNKSQAVVTLWADDWPNLAVMEKIRRSI